MEGASRAGKHWFLCYRAVSPLSIRRMPCATQDFAGTDNKAEQRGFWAVSCPSLPPNVFTFFLPLASRLSAMLAFGSLGLFRLVFTSLISAPARPPWLIRRCTCT